MRRHPLVVKSEAVLSSLEPDDYGMLRSWRVACLDIRVSPRRLRRALRIMNGVITLLAAKGSRVILTSDGKPRTVAIVDGQNILFALRESAKRYEHVPSKKEAEESKERRYRTYELWDHKPTGLLTLEIDRWRYWGIRTKWSDRQDQPLEDQIDSFVDGVVLAALKAREVEEERERERRAREMEEERCLAEQRRREAERQRVEELKRQAENMRQSRQVRDLIEEVRSRENGLGLSRADDSPLEAWLTWATKCADELDPVAGILGRCPPKPVENVGQVTPITDGVAGVSNSSPLVDQKRAGRWAHGTFDRKTLYEQVWSRPVQVVAKDYGVSGRGLAKACARLRVPVPPRGYWARVRNGHKESRPALPATIRRASLE
jgi:hypothetical protein